MELTHMDILWRLIFATVLGGLIGLEREVHGKDAGFRTYSMVTLGAALIMIVSLEIALVYKIPSTDPSRIAAQVVSGIGFLGAGAIIRFPQGSKETVKGLTTAAGLWASAGIGLACGLGLFFAATLTVVLMMVILLVFLEINRMIEKKKPSGGTVEHSQ